MPETAFLAPEAVRVINCMPLLVAFVVLMFSPLWAIADTPADSLVQAAPPEVTFEAPSLVLRNLPFTVSFTAPAGETFEVVAGTSRQAAVYDSTDNVYRAEGLVLEENTGQIAIEHAGAVLSSADTRTIPGWFSILPPLLAILVAFATRRVIPSLFLGIWLGAFLAYGVGASALWWGLLQAFEIYVLKALADDGHASILLFSLMIGGMVGIISKNGGTYGIVNVLIRFASTPKRGQIATSLLGIVIFFDDYANTLVVGNTMRPVTDKLRISREKLAYLVDSTAAPVASLALVTTWIGYEVGLIGTAASRIPGLDESAYGIFLNSIAYSFYPIFALFFLFVVATSNKEFGPMYKAELRARTTGQVLDDRAVVDPEQANSHELAPKEGKPHRAINAILPVLALVAGVLGGLYYTGVQSVGADAPLREIIGSADSYRALLWASLLSVLTAGVLSVGQRILTLDEAVDAWYSGMKSMLLAMIILVLAWALSAVTDSLQTATFLTSVLSDNLAPGVVPALVFVLAAATAFATGTSWGTMGILMPLVVPLAWGVMAVGGDPATMMPILYSTVSAVLAGAVWGDHCSPISDTTILSSMASGCDHVAHVKTQLPYAFLVGMVALVFGTLPVGFGLPWWVAMLVGPVLLTLIFHAIGKKVPGYNSSILES